MVIQEAKLEKQYVSFWIHHDPICALEHQMMLDLSRILQNVSISSVTSAGNSSCKLVVNSWFYMVLSVNLGVGSRNSSFDPRSYVCVTLCQLLFTEILPRQFYQVISVTPASKIMLNCWLCFYLFFVCSVPVACLVSSYWSAIAKWLATCCMRMSHDSTQHSYRVTFTGFVEILWPDSPEFVKYEMLG